mgnify:CR=1 FL=1
MEQKYTVDARGEQCPIPVVKTKKVLDGIQGDAEITVLVDNETAVQNLTRMGKHAGAEVLSEKKSDQEFQVIIRVKDQKQAETQEETVECIPDVKGDFVIAVDTATMGRGNDELGKVLMKGFIFAVTQLEKLPRTMLFYNGGATLTTEGSRRSQEPGSAGCGDQNLRYLPELLWPDRQTSGRRSYKHV